MSLDAGGLAQMTYQPHNSFNAGLAVPTSGFASRRGNRVSMAPPSNISTINESHPAQNVSPAPRTSRSHLLAGLRTAPKSPMYPSSAPPTQVQQPFNLDHARYAAQENAYTRGMPQTSVGGSFPNNQTMGMATGNRMNPLPEILAPPEVMHEGDYNSPEYVEVLAMKKHLAEQQLRLQQQLLQITAAQQQMQHMNLNSGLVQPQQFSQASTVPINNFYGQQIRQPVQQPMINKVQGMAGVYEVYNPMTGQIQYMVDNAVAQESQQPQSPPQVMNAHLSNSPPPVSPAFRAQVSPPPEDNTPVRVFRSPSPPKPKQTPPTEVQALPPPSANAFRRSHAKNLSAVSGSGASDGPKSALPALGGIPPTPQTGTFGPGQARAGDHPIRQPRGPPSLEELVEKPTSKHEGSKNFITRQRRRAVNNLVRAGLERRGASRGSNSIDSPGSGTPSSECEIQFSGSSDNDSDSVGSRSDPGAIGSERKKMKSRSESWRSPDTPATTLSSGSEEGFSMALPSKEMRSEVKPNPFAAFPLRNEKFRGMAF